MSSSVKAVKHISETLFLERFISLPSATLGRLTLPNGFECYTLERGWRGNKRFVSCIPEGTYELHWDLGGKKKGCPQLIDVPNRSEINIHPANVSSELQGCIAPGLTWSWKAGSVYLERSRDAFSEIMRYLKTTNPEEDGTLTVSLKQSIYIYASRQLIEPTLKALL